MEYNLPSMVNRRLTRGHKTAWAKAGFKAALRAVPLTAALERMRDRVSPVAYKLWRAACAALFFVSVGAGYVGGAFATVGRAAQAAAHKAHPRRMARGTAALLITIASLMTFAYCFYGMGLEVSIDGESQGYIRSEAQFEEAVAAVAARASDLLGTPYVMTPDVNYHFSLVSRSKLFDREEVEDMLFSRIPELKYMYVLTIDGDQIAASADRAVIDDVLSARKAEYKNYDSVDFLKDAEVVWQLAPVAMETDSAGFAAIVNSDLRPAAYYTVEYDESLRDTAKRVGMTADSLRALNPELGDELLPGTKLRLNYATPLLQIEATATLVYEETVPFETEYVDDPNQYTGRSKTVTEGVDGANRLTATANYLDGREISRDITNVEVLSAPVTEVIAVGVLKPPTFIRPYYGQLTSTFTMRTLFGRTRMHSGIDLAGPTGSPIVASCGGVVTFSGRFGDYGNCVIIDHGHGISTLYAHASKLLVKVGQTVKQGELIARVGSTGRSTGPHVHFEIRINNRPVNPMTYLK
ncbi:metalloendopeptidase [Clostridia bacterium]|nr:metalloendopeptidase [Clostridia bacterium]